MPTSKNSNVQVRRAKERGHANHGWLDSYHTFSFADYQDHKFMGFRSLRVINEDRVAAGMGFGSHPHQDMEILTYVIEGSLKHDDSMGHEVVMKAGDVQKITAGTGIVHREFNASSKDPVHFLQIWIRPGKRGLAPAYAQLSLKENTPGLRLFASSKKTAEVIPFDQDVQIYRGILSKGQKQDVTVKQGRALWIQMVKGNLQANGIDLKEGDGAAVENETAVTIEATSDVVFLMFDLA